MNPLSYFIADSEKRKPSVHAGQDFGIMLETAGGIFFVSFDKKGHFIPCPSFFLLS